MSDFKLTYSTMFDPPAELHTNFEAELEAVNQRLGEEYAMYIDGQWSGGTSHIEARNPANRASVLGRFALANTADVEAAVQAAKRAQRAWSATPLAERIRLMRRVAELVRARTYSIAVAVSLEVGKNRMEAIGKVAEVAEFFEIYALAMETNNGFDRKLPNDPMRDVVIRNRSVLKPYGVWAVIAPFNFPFALAGGPTAAALVTGNTVVLKGSTDTPWAGYLLAQCIHDAGIPAGVFNYLVGDATPVGEALVSHKDIGGVTFTGSYKAGMSISRTQAAQKIPRPIIAEMGGKNAVLVSEHADIDVAAQGIVRSAFGMSGQKCSALSRIYVHEAVADSLIARLLAEMKKISIGTPQAAANWIGPVTTRRGFDGFKEFCGQLRENGSTILAGGNTLTDAGFAEGFFCEPTLAESPLNHPLWQTEMFAPIVMLARVSSSEQGLDLLNRSDFGLTAGFYGSEAEVDWFFENVEAGVTYANRPQGATTGAWPGYQPFGGWKGSGTTGKAIASDYYLPMYMREQSQTRIHPQI